MVGVDAEDRIRVRVRESPVDGKANRALIRLLADRLGLTVSSVRITSGLKSKNKVVEITGIHGNSAIRELVGER